jgi:hypothetical protein
MQWEKDEIEREANRIASENELLDLRSPEVEGAHTSNSIDTGDTSCSDSSKLSQRGRK